MKVLTFLPRISRLSFASLLLAMLAITPLTLHAQGSTGALSVTMNSEPFVFSDDGDHLISGTMTNESEDTLIISFKRYQKLPKGWSSSVCFGTNCFAAIVDTSAEAFFPHESREFILHVNPRMVDVADSGWVYLRVSAQTQSAGDTVSFMLHPTYLPSDPPIIFIQTKADTAKSFTGNGPFVSSATFQNRSADTVMYKYHLDATVPSGWVPSMCLRDSCGTLTATGVDIQYPMVPLVSQSVRMRLENPSGTPLAEPDSAVFYLTVKPQTTNPADSMRFRYVAYLNPPSAVSEGPEVAGHRLMLGTVYPNPMQVSQSAAELSFSVDMSSTANLALVLYDVGGKVISQLPVGFVHEGVSTRSVSVRNVEAGQYFARLSDGISLSNPVLVRIVR